MIIALLAAVGFWGWMQVRPQPPMGVGILQWASHPALDQVREGFVEKLREELGDDVPIYVQNAEGSTAQAHLIARRFHHRQEVAAILTIATPATQAMAAVERVKPIIFAAVTDPSRLGAWGTQVNLAGVQDLVDVEATVDLVSSLVPDAHRVALLHDPSEVNAVSLLDRFEPALRAKGLEPVRMGVTSVQEMTAAAALAARKADVILTPTDSTIATSIDLLAAQAARHGVPLVVCDNLLVLKGALAARGVNYLESGRKAAVLAIDILGGAKPADLALVKPTAEKTIINSERLRALGLRMPPIPEAQLEVIRDEP